MQVKTTIVAETEEETVSSLQVDGESFGVILEDQYREKKVMADTRIPRGVYKLKLRTYGGHHQRYKAKYPDFHVGMIEIIGIENFSDVLFHIGNTDQHTAGCLLNGTTFMETRGKRLVVQRSEDAYVKFYKKVAPELTAGKEVLLYHGV